MFAPQALNSPRKLPKFTPPTPSERVYGRTRLFERLDAIRAKRVIWISAPAGSGKTTLIASYLRERGLPALWYHLDSGDGDAASFFSYLGLAAPAQSASSGPLPLFTAEYVAGITTFARNFFREFFARLQNAPILVFDDYHEVPVESPLHTAFREGLAEVPEGVSVIIISRAGPPPELARLHVREDFVRLDWQDLRLTVEEAVAIGCHRLGEREAEPSTLQALHERTQGWVAGLILMLEQGAGITALEGIERAGDPLVFDYFAGEVFSRTDARLQEFLLTTALLPTVIPAIATALTGMDDADLLLEALHRRNYFTVRHPGSDGAYEYHPLFRSFLLAQGRRMLPAPTLAELKRRAATLLLDQQEVEPCITLLQQAEEWQTLAAVLQEHVPRLLGQGRHQTVTEWLLHLPETTLAANPWLQFYLAQSRLPFDLKEARRCFERSYRGFAEGTDAAGAYSAWCGIIDTYVYEWADFKAADRWIDEFTALRANHPDFPSMDIELKTGTARLAILMYRRPQHPDLPAWAERIEAYLFEQVDPLLRMMAANYLVLYLTWWCGNLGKVAALLKRLETYAEAPGLAPLMRITWQCTCAIYFWMAGENDRCRAAVTRGLEVGRAHGLHMWDFMLLAQGTFAEVTDGNLAEARELLEQLRSRLPPGAHLLACQYHYLNFMEAVYREDRNAMLEHASAGLRYGQEAGVVWAEGFNWITLGRIRFRRGDHEGAAECLETAWKISKEIGSHTIAYGVLEAQIEHALLREQEDEALACVRQLLPLMRDQGFANSAWWRSDFVARFLSLALEQHIEPDYVRHLIALRGLRSPRRSSEHWPWPVRVYTLGRFEVVLDGTPLRFSGKTQKKPLELLKALIAYGGAAVPVAKITEALWPDADGDAAYRTFVVTLQRLRKLLKGKERIVHRDGCLGLGPDCWVDIVAFKALTGGATALQPSERLFSLYQGPFLSQELDAYWAIAPRERLRQRFSSAVCDLGKRLEEAGRRADAVRCYERALGRAPEAPEIQRRLAACNGLAEVKRTVPGSQNSE